MVTCHICVQRINLIQLRAMYLPMTVSCVATDYSPARGSSGWVAGRLPNRFKIMYRLLGLSYAKYNTEGRLSMRKREEVFVA
jgi:hypothetical protein